MNCPQCGNIIEANQKFCGSCGFKLDSQQVVSPPISQPTQTSEPVNPQYQQPPMQHIPNQQPMHQPYQPPKKKKGKGCLIFLLIIVILGAGGFIAYKKIMAAGIIPDNFLQAVTDPTVSTSNSSSSGLEITNITFTTDPITMSDAGTAFNSVSTMTVFANLNNITNTLNIEILWLYEDEEILVEMHQYQDGEILEHTIETTDGSFFDIGIYTVIFYVDGVDVDYASFEIL